MSVCVCVVWVCLWVCLCVCKWVWVSLWGILRYWMIITILLYYATDMVLQSIPRYRSCARSLSAARVSVGEREMQRDAPPRACDAPRSDSAGGRAQTDSVTPRQSRVAQLWKIHLPLELQRTHTTLSAATGLSFRGLPSSTAPIDG